MIIWALFDSETCSVAKAFKGVACVYSFGIGSGTDHIELDLSNFKTAKIELDKYPKPNVIFASPPCETWVLMSVGNLRHYKVKGGYNLYWKNRWEPYDFTEAQKQKRLNGMKTAICTRDIIQYYKPEFWAIENGNSSLVFDYLYENGLSGVRNKCNYFSYGLDVYKPTIIYSNKILNLRNWKPNRKLLLVKDISKKSKKSMQEKYGNISQVPLTLYKSIMFQFLNPPKTLLSEAV